MPTLWGVEIPVRQRIALISIFAMGSLVVIGGVFRIYWVWFCVAHTWDTTCKLPTRPTYPLLQLDW